MRIVHVIGYFRPNLGYQEYYLALHQSNLGHDVLVVTSNKAYSSNESEDYALGFSHLSGFDVLRLPAYIERGGVIAIKGLRNAIKAFEPDVLHAHSVFQLAPAFTAFWKDEMKFKLLIDHHMPIVSRTVFGSLYNTLIERTIAKFAFKKADKIMSIYAGSERYLVQKFPFVQSKLVRLTAGADIDIFKRNLRTGSEIRSKLAIPEDANVLIYCGRITAEKQLPTLLKAVAHLDPSLLTYLILVGHGRSYFVNRFKKSAEKLGIMKNVRFVGHVPKESLFKYYSAAQVAIWPAHTSIGILEAMACGLTIVLGSYSTNEHLYVPYPIPKKYVNLFLEGDFQELSKILESLLKEPNKLEEISKQNIDFIREERNWESIGRQSIKIYEELLA